MLQSYGISPTPKTPSNKNQSYLKFYISVLQNITSTRLCNISKFISMCLITPFHGPGNTKIPDFIEEIRDYDAGLMNDTTQAMALTGAFISSSWPSPCSRGTAGQQACRTSGRPCGPCTPGASSS